MNMNKCNFAFFGGSSFSIAVLDELEKVQLLPTVIVTMPDKRRGRDKDVSANEVKVWATERNIPVLTPEKLKDPAFEESLKAYPCDVFIVASYGKIIPESILYLSKHKTLNIHPSLLPAYRGASPVQSMILANEEHPGVSIMELDKEMDHGPILAMKEIKPDPWPTTEEAAKEFFGREGAKLLASILPDWMSGDLKAIPQDHTKATFTKKIEKEDGLIDLSSDPHKNYLKILAYHHWPRAYFFDSEKRIVVTDAEYKDNQLVIKKVIPEGKKEMLYADYLRGKR